MQDKLSKLYFGTLLQIDSNLELLIRKGSAAGIDEWHKQHTNSFDVSQNLIDDFLTELAFDLKLSAFSLQKPD